MPPWPLIRPSDYSIAAGADRHGAYSHGAYKRDRPNFTASDQLLSQFGRPGKSSDNWCVANAIKDQEITIQKMRSGIWRLGAI
jgi:hypothetical protein